MQSGRKGSDVLGPKRFDKTLVSACNLTEEGCGLLPFAFGIDVAVVPASKAKDIQQVVPRLIVFHERLPRNVSGSGKLSERGGTELRMLSEKCHDLNGIDVADHSQASAPWISIAIRREQVPPSAHLRFQRGFKRLHQVFASNVFS